MCNLPMLLDCWLIWHCCQVKHYLTLFLRVVIWYSRWFNPALFVYLYWLWCPIVNDFISYILMYSLQEPLSALASEYQSGSPILLEKIKVVNLCILLWFIGGSNCLPLKVVNVSFCRFLVSSMLPLGVHEEMGTASFEVLCSPILYVLIFMSLDHTAISNFELPVWGKLIRPEI